MNAVLYVSYHSNGEVVVDDFIGHRVTSLLTVLQGHLYAPAIHRNHRTALNVLQDPAQIHSIITYNIITVRNSKHSHESICSSFKFSFCSPPPHRRQRARSFPVPRGSTATGGRIGKLALSLRGIEKNSWLKVKWELNIHILYGFASLIVSQMYV